MPVNIGINIQRSPNRINQQLREAGVEGKFPKLLLDFQDEYYLANGSSKTLANAVTHARSGNATMTDGYGSELVFNGTFEDLSDSADRFRNIDDELLRAAISVEPQATEFDVLVDGRKIGDISNNGSVTAFDASQYTGWLLGSLTNQTYIDYIQNVLNPYIDANLSKYTTGYTLGDGWSIRDGHAYCDGSQSAASNLEQTVTIPSAGTYIFEFNVVEATTSSVGISFVAGTATTTSTGTYTSRNTKGKLSRVFVFSDGGTFTITAGAFSTFVGAVDNFTFREMPVIKWAPHNLVTYSEELDNAAWTKNATTITANATTAPNGTTTADLFVPSASNAFHRITQRPFAVNERGSFCVWAKANGYNLISIREDQTTGSALTVDLSDQSTIKYETGGCTIADVSVVSASNDWYKISGTFVGIANIGFGLLVTDPSYTSGIVTGSWTADGTSGIYIWGAHVYRSDLGGMVDNPERGDSYVPTTTAAKYLPRIGHHVYNGSAWVNEGLLAESESRTNQLTYSTDLSNSDYIKGNSTVTADSAVSPDGTENAGLFAQNSTSDTTFRVWQTVTLDDNSDYTFSVYLKKKDENHAFLELRAKDGTQYKAWFDLVNGTKGSTANSPSQTTIQNVGNDWYRCSITVPSNAGAGSTLALVGMAEADNDETLVGVVGEGIYIYGPQLEKAATPSSYIPTDSATVTRAAETFTIPSANLPWPSLNYIGSELITNGTFDSDISNWTAGGNGTLSHSSGQLVIEDNGYAYQVITTEVGKLYYAEVEVTAVSSSPAGSWELRIGTSEYPPDIYDGPSIFTTGKESTTFVATTTSTYIVLKTHGTTGGTQTVTWDNVTVREINPLSVSIAMDGRMTYADDGASISSTPTTGTANFYSWASDSSNYIATVLDTELANEGIVRFTQEHLTTYDSSASTDIFSPDVLVPFDIASRHGSTFVNGGINGVALTENTTPTALVDLSATDLNLAYKYMGTIGTFRVWDKDIGDTGLVEATNPSLEPSLSLTFEGVGTNSFVVNDWSE